jgi:peptidoglycan/xylan/chitin deacetylase (PgdA/CDA1 family)
VTTIWRDDDVGRRTKLDVLTAVDDVFQQYKARHTIAVMAEGLDSRPELVDLIIQRGMDVQLHCWKHDDLTTEPAQADLLRAVEMLEQLFGARPTVLYPPWNRADSSLCRKAAELGMIVSAAKISLDQYLRFNGDVGEQVVNFHHWYVPEAMQLERALKIAASR